MLHQAEQKDSLVREGPRKEDIAAARADVARAQAAVKTAEANRSLTRQFENRQVTKKYLFLTDRPSPPSAATFARVRDLESIQPRGASWSSIGLP